MSNGMQPIIKAYLLDEQGQRFFGDGPCRLLRMTEQTGSLRAAAAKMGMAYTKALKLIRHAEEACGVPLLARTTGGKDGGGSRMTDAGKELVERYECWKAQSMEAADKLYLEIFGGHR